MITCPCCGKELLVFLDIPGDGAPPPDQQKESSNLLHRWQVCHQCRTHTNQKLVEVEPYKGRWTCETCGHRAKKSWPLPTAVRQTQQIEGMPA